eukprot:CAMPEP_0194161186 /NCGR_PEP_ID=MMETSP0152-20130528/78799_1 /TAXON_ID=1049557 /ORGANISM="Thalassiothrix antarctica, Strain L6-D1" /LENGTH=789 /DNA_ID=CAMNT_0038870943 /DNA_START=535 /DNA_END=2904 /DNA_ORIENTATION=+
MLLHYATEKNGKERKHKRDRYSFYSVNFVVAATCLFVLSCGTSFDHVDYGQLQDGMFHFAFVSAQPPPKRRGGDFSGRIEKLAKRARESRANPQETLNLWKEVLSLDPRHLEGNYQLGIMYFSGYGPQMEGLKVLGKVLEGSEVGHVDEVRIPGVHLYDTIGREKVFTISNCIGRWNWQMRDYTEARKFIEISVVAKPDDNCAAAMQATLIDNFPETVQDADKSLRLYHEEMDKFLERTVNPQTQHLQEQEQQNEGFLPIDPSIYSSLPGVNEDPFVHCVLQMFHHSFYYRADVRSSAAKQFQLVVSLFPDLLYTSPMVTRRNLMNILPPSTPNDNDDGGKERNNIMTSSKSKPCVRRKIRLGIVSGFLSEGSSVTADFQGVIRRLDKNIFDIWFIYLRERVELEPAKFLLDQNEVPSDRVLLITRNVKENVGENAHMWLKETRTRIVKLNLDILFYLDCTMSSHAQRLAMSKLAPVQALSHGHPMTSGIPSQIMDYYISWAAAELPYAESSKHYTETLKLLPGDTLHQYYEPRVVVIDHERHSATDRMPFGKLVSEGGRQSLLPNVPSSGNWYLCMQKPFKLHPEFSYFVAEILRADPFARILLHDADIPQNQGIVRRRLENAGVNSMNFKGRVHFILVQPHHRLLALYELSTVILDGYPAGGCTTTREVLELGKAIITLPANFLGSRWTLGYYNILNDTKINDAVVAKNELEYVRLAVALGTNSNNIRTDTEKRIRDNVHKLFHRDEPIQEWTKMFLDISPVCIHSDNDTKKNDEDTGNKGNRHNEL